MGQKASDELIGELAEGLVDLGLQQGEGSGVACQLLGPELLLGGEVGADLLDGLVGGGGVGTLRGLESNTHGWSFRDTSLLQPTIALEAVIGTPFWEWTLFTGSPTIDGSSAIGSFTEVSGDSSYTAQSVASGSWSFALSSDVYTGTATPVTFLFADSHTVNGYWVQNGDGSVLYWSETFASPISVDSSTPLQLTLTISLGMC